IAFAVATEEHPARYYTTLSEPHAKLIRHLEPFSFFDHASLGKRVSYLHLTELAQGNGDDQRGLGAALDEIVEGAFDHRPSLVVIDSSKALHHFADGERLRETIFSLASRVAHTGASLLLVGEYTSDELETSPEFAVADGIIQVSNTTVGPVDRRVLRVVKMRGTDYLTGQHTFRLGPGGYELFPRLETTSPSSGDHLADTRHGFGLPQVDEMTSGGTPAGDATLLMGPSGVGKTALACHWIQEGLDRGERCLFVTLEETPAELLAKARTFGLRFEAALRSGDLRILHVPPIELEIDEFGVIVRDHVEQNDQQRVVIDSLGELLPAAKALARFPSYLWALTLTLRERGSSAMFTYEMSTLGAADRLDSLSYLFQNVLVLRYMERGSELGRVLTVLKMRRSAHAKGLLQFQITGDGFTPVGQADVASGVLGWTVIGSPVGGN
ncbi:MAG: AAA family ATPase, partial [Actinobacteria bacterium]|nr:AAA family ATPase [Actinomycetota bacterium]